MTNCWRVRFGMDFYAILPTHVAIYKNCNEWILSPFLKECESMREPLKWNIPFNWKNHMRLCDDFAWAKLAIENKGHNLETNSLSSSIQNLSEPINADFYYNQPYDANGVRVDVATFGKITGIVYPSPNSSLLESLNIGHKGFSGAVCVDDSNGLVGMFIRRGTELGQNNDALPPL
jgi:hypothetical protein